MGSDGRMEKPKRKRGARNAEKISSEGDPEAAVTLWPTRGRSVPGGPFDLVPGPLSGFSVLR